jgi:hypothetical protein
MRRSLVNLKKKNTKNIVRLTRERRKGRKKLFWAEIAKNLQKVPKRIGVPAKNLQILSREMNAPVKRSGLSPNKPYFGRFGQKVPKSAK